MKPAATALPKLFGGGYHGQIAASPELLDDIVFRQLKADRKHVYFALDHDGSLYIFSHMPIHRDSTAWDLERYNTQEDRFAFKFATLHVKWETSNEWMIAMEPYSLEFLEELKDHPGVQ